MSPLSRFGSDLTNTIRARSQTALHQEAGHTTVPGQLPPTLGSESVACPPGGVHIQHTPRGHTPCVPCGGCRGGLRPPSNPRAAARTRTGAFPLVRDASWACSPAMRGTRLSMPCRSGPRGLPVGRHRRDHHAAGVVVPEVVDAEASPRVPRPRAVLDVPSHRPAGSACVNHWSATMCIEPPCRMAHLQHAMRGLRI